MLTVADQARTCYGRAQLQTSTCVCWQSRNKPNLAQEMFKRLPKSARPQNRNRYLRVTLIHFYL